MTGKLQLFGDYNPSGVERLKAFRREHVQLEELHRGGSKPEMKQAQRFQKAATLVLRYVDADVGPIPNIIPHELASEVQAAVIAYEVGV